MLFSTQAGLVVRGVGGKIWKKCHITYLLLYFFLLPTIASFEKHLILEHRLYVLSPYCILKFAVCVLNCASVWFQCRAMFSCGVLCTWASFIAQKRACACPFYCCKARLHRKVISEIIEGIKMTSVCAARPVPNGAVGFLCSSSMAGLLFTALQRKRLPSHIWESSANIWGTLVAFRCLNLRGFLQ